MFTIPPTEQETVVNFSRNEKGFWIYTSDVTMIRKLEKLCEESEYYTQGKRGRVGTSYVDSEFYCSDRALLSFRKKRSKREYTEEQRALIGQRLSQAREQ